MRDLRRGPGRPAECVLTRPDPAMRHSPRTTCGSGGPVSVRGPLTARARESSQQKCSVAHAEPSHVAGCRALTWLGKDGSRAKNGEVAQRRAKATRKSGNPTAIVAAAGTGHRGPANVSRPPARHMFMPRERGGRQRRRAAPASGVRPACPGTAPPSGWRRARRRRGR